MKVVLRRGGLTVAAALAAVLASVTPAVAQEAQEDFQLSRPSEHMWRWAFVERATGARAYPAEDAPVVAGVRTRTPERTREMLPLLERRSVDGQLWVRARLPVLPNGTTGWVRRDRLSGYTTVRTHLIVDRARFTARLERKGRTVFRARIGIGERRWPTPRGSFMVRNRLAGFNDPVYGVLAFGTTARSATLTDWPGGGFIGIHGTSRPEILPGRVSHGCIRMRNADILRLDRRMPVGTPVSVR
ncbi:MAG TPA: L,D-transpeptidase [Solirubrobacteraceae bacterium]|nr:L,D-transpeptidase [Solirubrobacteraceae bacterium]